MPPDMMPAVTLSRIIFVTKYMSSEIESINAAIPTQTRRVPIVHNSGGMLFGVVNLW